MNFLIILLASVLACGFLEIFRYFERCHINYTAKKNEKSEIYVKKCRKLHDKAFFYYYDMATTKPELLAYELATLDIKRLKENNLIDYMYSSLKRAS